ncbi:MAG: hypothetical protein AB7W47_04455 [Calditrichaceae bacterium]
MQQIKKSRAEIICPASGNLNIPHHAFSLAS